MSEEKSIPEIPYEPLSRGGSVHDHGFAYVASDPGPELVTLPEGAQVYPRQQRETTGKDSAASIIGWLFKESDFNRAMREQATESARHEANRLRRLNEAEEGIRALPFSNVDELREFVKAIVRETLEEDARELATNKAFQTVYVPAWGACWACGQTGTEMQWFTCGGRSHLIHRTEECRMLAEEKPETGEHRG